MYCVVKMLVGVYFLCYLFKLVVLVLVGFWSFIGDGMVFEFIGY